MMEIPDQLIITISLFQEAIHTPQDKPDFQMQLNNNVQEEEEDTLRLNNKAIIVISLQV